MVNVYLIFLKYTVEDKKNERYYLLSSTSTMNALRDAGFIIPCDEFNLVLYGFTNKKERKDIFMKIRDKNIFYVKSVLMSHEEYAELKQFYRDGHIRERMLMSGLTDDGVKETPVVMTDYEFMITTTEDLDEIYYTAMGLYTLMDVLPTFTGTSVFSDKVKEALDALGVSRFLYSSPDDTTDPSLNELNMFLTQFYNTLRKDL